MCRQHPAIECIHHLRAIIAHDWNQQDSWLRVQILEFWDSGTEEGREKKTITKQERERERERERKTKKDSKEKRGGSKSREKWQWRSGEKDCRIMWFYGTRGFVEVQLDCFCCGTLSSFSKTRKWDGPMEDLEVVYSCFRAKKDTPISYRVLTN